MYKIYVILIQLRSKNNLFSSFFIYLQSVQNTQIKELVSSVLYTVGTSNTFPLQLTNQDLDQNQLFSAIHRFTQLLLNYDYTTISTDRMDKTIENLYSLTSYKTWPKYWIMLKRQITYLVETCQPGNKIATGSDNNSTSVAYIKHKIWMTLRGQITDYLSQNSQSFTEYTANENVIIHKFLMMPIALNNEPVI